MDTKTNSRSKQNLIERMLLLGEPVKNAIDGIYIKENNSYRLGTTVYVKPKIAKLMKRVAWMLTASMLIMLSIVTTEYTLALKVSLDGEVVGYVENIDAANHKVEEAEEHISAVLGEQYELEGVSYTRGIVKNTEVTAVSDISAALTQQAAVIEPMCVLSIGGVELGAVASIDEYAAVIGNIINYYNIGGTAAPVINTTIDAVNKEAPVDFKMSADELALTIINARDENGNPLLTVTQEVEETKRETVPYESVVVYDDAQYLDYSAKVQSGREGRVDVTSRMTYVNGELTDSVVVGESVIIEKLDEIYVHGTMEIPYWRATGEFISPVENIRKVTSDFGTRRWSQHTGTDLAGRMGEPILASDSGTVTFSGWGIGGYGRLVVIDHGNGYETYYAHNSKLVVKEGDHVVQGDTIALLGSSGKSTGPHLHFEIRYEGEPLDTADFIEYVAELD